MITLLGYTEKRSEITPIRRAAREAAANLDISDWEADVFETRAEFLKRIDELAQADICCLDISGSDGIPMAEGARRRYEDARILLIAEPDMPPTRYLRPSIHASALLLRPLDEDETNEAFAEILGEIQRGRKKTQGVFTVESREGRNLIPYDDIAFFEAREKRIILSSRGKELPFYSTLEKLQEALPSCFFRCHKGFIVNESQVRRIRFSQNIVEMEDGFQIPLSRTYKKVVRERDVSPQ